MITADFTNIKIAGIAAAVPTKCVQAHDYDDVFGEETVSKNISFTGVKQAYQLAEKQAPSDLAYVAARKLIRELNIKPENIGVLIFVCPYLDYVMPPTACVLHGRLGLSTNCLALDSNLGCSGFVYGLSTISSLLQSSNAQYGLLLTSEVGQAAFSPLDRSRILFGAGGTATLVTKCNTSQKMHFGIKTDGSRFKSMIIPAGAYRRNPRASHSRSLWSDGNIRSEYDTFMNGTDIFNFSMTDVPQLALEFFEHYQYSANDFDAFILHQPNLFILKRLIKKLGSTSDRMPISLDRYGNTGASSIPLTICDKYHNLESEMKFFIYGFGVGLSWACASIEMNTAQVYSIEFTDDYFNDGIISRETQV